MCNDIFYNFEKKENQGDPAQIKEQLNIVLKEIKAAESVFNSATDERIIEACIFHLQSLISYRDYLFSKAKNSVQNGQCA